MELLRTWLGHPEDIYNLLRFKMGGYRVVMPRIDPVRGRGCPGARPRGDGGGREGSVRGPAAGFGGDLGCSGGFASLPGLCMVLSIAPWGLRAPLALHRQPAGRARRARSRFAPGFGVPGTLGCCRHRSGPNARGWVLPCSVLLAPGCLLHQHRCSAATWFCSCFAPLPACLALHRPRCFAAACFPADQCFPCIAATPCSSLLLPGCCSSPGASRACCPGASRQLAACYALPRCFAAARCFPSIAPALQCLGVSRALHRRLVAA